MKRWIDRLWQRDDWVHRAFEQALRSFAAESAGKRRKTPHPPSPERPAPQSVVMRVEPVSIDTLG